MANKNKTAADFLKTISMDDAHVIGGHFLSLAFGDYIAARVLLLTDCPFQGLIMASTSIEKYLKAVLATKGKISPVHLDRKDFLDVIKASGLDVSYLSESFIKYLGHAYQFRYIDINSGPSSVVIEVRKVLAELDFSVSMLEKYALQVRDGKRVKRTYEKSVEEKDRRICQENHIVDGKSKAEFLSTPGTVQCVVVKPMQPLFSFPYYGFISENDANFDFPTLTFDGANGVLFKFRDAQQADHFHKQIEKGIANYAKLQKNRS
jgi:HEPN domain-containing protein